MQIWNKDRFFIVIIGSRSEDKRRVVWRKKYADKVYGKIKQYS